MALGTRTKFQLEILTINVIAGIVYFREIILESSRNVSETTPVVRNAFPCHDTNHVSLQAMAVHCQMGRGRTGAMLGCYLIKHNNLTAEKAIREIRRLRPGSLETKEQEQLLHQFEQSMKSRDS